MNYLPILSILFYAISITSCITGQKLITLYGSVISVGTFIFPLTYLLGVAITEVYGFKNTKTIIFTSFFCNILISIFFYICMYLEPFMQWPGESTYKSFLSMASYIIITSSLAYLCSEYINARLISKLNIITRGGLLLPRTMVSISTAITLDAILMIPIIIINSPTAITNVLFSLIAYKIIYIMVLLPFFIKTVEILKRKESIDSNEYVSDFSCINYV